MTAALDEVSAEFEKALYADAGAAEPPDIPAPPRRTDRDPAAPHGRDENGTPLAPHGVKADGTPRIKPPGPGRGGADKARVTVAQTAPPAAAGAAAKGGAADYTADLQGLGISLWIGASTLKGGRLGPVRLPDCRPYAALWHDQLPKHVAAWNAAAQQNPAVRGYVEKLTGEGSMTWVIAVAVTSAAFAAGCAELARGSQEIRDKAAAVNDANMAAYIGAQVEAMGLEEA